VAADAFLVAMGSFSPQLVAPLGLRLPVYPVKGYSLTVPIVDEARAPSPPCSMKATRWRSPALATASAWAAWRKSRLHHRPARSASRHAGA
jgi:hypothetical protein